MSATHSHARLVPSPVFWQHVSQAFRGFLRDAAPLRPRETLFHVDMLLGVELSICHVIGLEKLRHNPAACISSSMRP
jgi:hypothetical protein